MKSSTWFAHGETWAPQPLWRGSLSLGFFKFLFITGSGPRGPPSLEKFSSPPLVVTVLI